MTREDKKEKKMKSYTDLEQSKKLAEILPPESADMWWLYVTAQGKHIAMMYEEPDPHYLARMEGYGIKDAAVRCWSLAALLDILSKIAHSIDEDGSVDLCDYKNIEWSLCLTNTNVGLFTANNPVDACYQMIIKLHEIKML